MATKTFNNLHANPFSDSQARLYSDTRILQAFSPNEKFWSLFNDQHEIVVGTRGCGKTTLLKMMRYSALKYIEDQRAVELVAKKEYICFFIALPLEYIAKYQYAEDGLSPTEKAGWFYFIVSCRLALSILDELKTLLNDVYGVNYGIENLTRARAEYRLVKRIDDIWNIDKSNPVVQISTLIDKVMKLYTNATTLSEIPKVFKDTLGGVLSCISNTICDELKLQSHPTWIVCIDEAEFTNELQQMCFNTAFRSDTDRIAYKIATLHYHHKTNKTLSTAADALEGQDYKHTDVDLLCDGDDFRKLADYIIETRLSQIGIENIKKLEDFLVTIDKDEPSDYYEREFNRTRSEIDSEILMHVSRRTREHNSVKSKDDRRKPLTDKLAPLFILREMKKKSGIGNTKVGWFVGASMMRRISQGNPRIFIQLMWKIFDTALIKSRLIIPIKIEKQYDAVVAFSWDFCEKTADLKRVGIDAKNALERISQYIELKVHGKCLVNAGTSFMFSLSEDDFDKQKDWIHEAIAFSRLIVDNHSTSTEISVKTSFMLVNAYAVNYWLPMSRKTSPPYKISNAILETQQRESLSRTEKENEIYYTNFEQLKLSEYEVTQDES